MDSYKAINDLLVHLFRDINDLESKAIITEEFFDITNNDMHVIEAIGIEQEKNMSCIAKELSVTVGTLTIAMNSLVKKGYVLRRRGTKDRRVVYITLTPKGQNAYLHHQRFHKSMVEAILQELSLEETEVLVKTLDHLQIFFKQWK